LWLIEDFVFLCLVGPNTVVNQSTPTGIKVLGDSEWGKHYCHFYETKQDLMDILIPYFKAGLENDEYCIWITSEPVSIEDAEKQLQKAVPDFGQYVQGRRIEILSYTKWYVSGGSFSKEDIIADWLAKIDVALTRGLKGVRVNGVESWVKNDTWKDFMEYESALNQAIAGHRILLICTYALKGFGAAEILDVARVHEAVIAKRQGDWEIVEVPELKESKAEIKKVNVELEQRVAKRTKSLEIANKKLEKEVTERKRTAETLRKSDHELRSLFAAMTDAVVVLDDNGRYRKIAPTQALHLYPLDEGKKLNDFLSPEYASLVLEKIRQTLNTQQPTSVEYSLAVDNKRVWFEGRISPLTERTVFCIAHNITDQKLAEAERARILGDMAQHYKNLELFAQIVSHDVRGPVASILGIAEVMKRESTTPDERLEFLSIYLRL
jgi:PAS domain S-box-containing protein